MPWGARHGLLSSFGWWAVLLDGVPSHNGPLLGLFESLRGGTLGTHPCQQPPSAWQVSRCWVIWIFLVSDEFVKYSILGTKYSGMKMLSVFY
jgi:hypothetical protein